MSLNQKAIYLDAPSYRKSNGSVRYRVSIHHLLGFKWHNLEGAGIFHECYVYIP